MKQFIFFATIAFFVVQCQSINDPDSKKNAPDCLPDVENRYVYPDISVKDFSSIEEIENAYQIPENILKSLSTAAVIRGLLDMPLLHGYYYTSSNSSPIGKCTRIYDMHNSVSELAKRKDVSDVLLAFYRESCFDCLPAMDPLQEMTVYAQITVLQSLFTRQAILDQYDALKKKELVKLFLDKYEQFPNYGILEVVSWIMYDDQYMPVVAHFSSGLDKEWFNINSDEINDIISFAKSYIL